jgi:glycosyltransferase involved in cell wall biosynthesis
MSVTAPRGSQQKRILYVTNKAETLVSHRLPIARAARDAGYDVHVATPDGPEVAVIREAGFAWHQFSMVRSSLNPLHDWSTMLQLRRIYRSVQPNIVHHVTPKIVIFGTIAARLARVPGVVNAVSGVGHVFAQNGLHWRMIRGPVRTGYATALRHRNMRVVFQNPDHRDEFLKWRMVPPRAAVLIPGVGVDVNEYSPATVPPGDPPLVVLPARMLWTKGVGEFVEAARILRAEGVNARFALVGNVDPGNPASVPATMLHRWHEEGPIEYWGFRADMPGVLRQASIACLPSYSEGFPKSLLEAAACGLPIVTTDTSGCRMVVRQEENGLLVPLRDARSLTDALRRLLSDGQLRRRMGDGGRARAIAEFSLSAIAEAHLALYETVGGLPLQTP